jgi:Tol biopolymer transport system component/DNA-binding winged helix-turn-helix (wHTH) protein
MSNTITHFYRFGDFALDADQRVLLRGDKPVALTPKVFETLLILVEEHGRIVGKDKLMDRLWPDSFVEETNLTFNIQKLRKALGDRARQPRYVETVSKRGYRFIAGVTEVVENSLTQNGNDAESPSRLLSSFAPLHETALSNSNGNGKGWPTEHKQQSLINGKQKRTLFITAVSISILIFGAGSLRHFITRLNHRSAAGLAQPFKVQKLTETARSNSAAISPDGNFVAYTLEAKGRQSVWLRQLSTGNSSEIVAMSERLGGLVFAHNGQHLYFVKGAPSWALYRVTVPLGGVPEKVVEHPEGAFSLSPEDKQVAFIRYSPDDRSCALMIADVDGSNERVLAVHQQPDRFNTPAWSPDGRTIAVAVGPSDSGHEQVRIVTYDVAGGSEREVPAGRWFHIGRLVWQPDGNGLFVVGTNKFGQGKQIWRVEYSTGESKQLTDGTASYSDVNFTADANMAVASQVSFTSNIWIGPADNPEKLTRITHAAEDFCWTPDGKIIYSSGASLTKNLWVMRADGSELKQLTNAGQRNATPAITGEGRFIIFTSTRSGTIQIWRMEADGSNPTQLTTGAGANYPALSPDGKWLVYNSVADWSLWKIPIEGGQPMRLTEGYAIYPSVSPDGKLIAFVGKDENKNRQLVIVSAAGGNALRRFVITPLKLSSYRLKWTPNGDALLYAAASDGVAGIYKQNLKGGTPEKLIELKEDDISDFGYSADGRELAVTRGDWQFDIVLLSGIKL